MYLVSKSGKISFNVLTQAHKVLTDQSIPIIKKLFVIRFVKDTMLLASLSFMSASWSKYFLGLQL
jgi:hypothetical protein